MVVQIDYMFLLCKTSNTKHKWQKNLWVNPLILLGKSIATTLILEKLYATNNWDLLAGIEMGIKCTQISIPRMQLMWLCSNVTITNFVDKIVLPTLPSCSNFVFRAPILMQGAFPKPYTIFKTFDWMVAICASHHPMILTIELQTLLETILTRILIEQL